MTEAEIIKTIKAYNDMCENISLMFRECQDKLKECERKTIDYYHELELNDLTYHQQGKLTNKQVENLLVRRQCKDMIEFLTPFKRWLDNNGQTTHTNKQLIQSLRESQKIVSNRELRKYSKRSIDE